MARSPIRNRAWRARTIPLSQSATKGPRARMRAHGRNLSPAGSIRRHNRTSRGAGGPSPTDGTIARKFATVSQLGATAERPIGTDMGSEAPASSIVNAERWHLHAADAWSPTNGIPCAHHAVGTTDAAIPYGATRRRLDAIARPAASRDDRDLPCRTGRWENSARDDAAIALRASAVARVVFAPRVVRIARVVFVRGVVFVSRVARVVCGTARRCPAAAEHARRRRQTKKWANACAIAEPLPKRMVISKGGHVRTLSPCDAFHDTGSERAAVRRGAFPFPARGRDFAATATSRRPGARAARSAWGEPLACRYSDSCSAKRLTREQEKRAAWQ
jgi:hypothetical protein